MRPCSPFGTDGCRATEEPDTDTCSCSHTKPHEPMANAGSWGQWITPVVSRALLPEVLPMAATIFHHVSPDATSRLAPLPVSLPPMNQAIAPASPIAQTSALNMV